LDFYVGTSGWSYAWNEKKSLDWYVSDSGLNAVELNGSFYRYPSASAVESWVRKSKDLRWSVKVNHAITHNCKLGENALEFWKRFHDLFKPLESKVDFFLFQLPPSTTPKSMVRIEEFFKKTSLGERFALEVRSSEWFKEETVKWASNLGLTLVSVDSPDFPRDLFNTSGNVYVRMHGRKDWYSYRYSLEELEEVAKKIIARKPERVYLFFNNDHAMLENAREMLRILRERK